MAECWFDGCQKTARSRGLCPGHYAQIRRGEALRPLQLQYHGLSELDRFMKRVQVAGPDECWNWTASVQNGWHGQWRNAKGKHDLAHRVAWRLLKGEIPEGMCILHKCDNPRCCNPQHMMIGTQSDNAHDMWRKKRANPGTSLGEKHGMAKLTGERVRLIRESEESDAQLASKFGISRATVHDVRIRRTWKHVT